MMIFTHIVSAEEQDLTLDSLLRGPLGFSTAQARESKRLGITADDANIYGNQRVSVGQRLMIPLAAYEKGEPSPSAPPIDVLYEDEALLAVFKPALLQCHPSSSAPGHSDTLERRVQSYLGAPAHPVHRLDAETTGPVLFAKLPYVQSHIQRQMQLGQFKKTYRAWVFGVPAQTDGVIDAPIALSEPDSFTRVVRADGQRAVSRFRLLRTIALPTGGSASLVELYPETGRTHQLRVHMTHIGCPLLGDARYHSESSLRASRALGLGYHQLSAVSLTFFHPLSGQETTISSAERFAFHPENL